MKKNVRMQSCSFQKDLQFLFHTVSDKTYIFSFNSKNTIKIQKFHFLNKICGMQKKRLDGKLFALMGSTNSHQDTSRQDLYFMF